MEFQYPGTGLALSEVKRIGSTGVPWATKAPFRGFE